MALALQDMTLEEKLEAMELLWEDLRKQGASLKSPSWHADVLRQRDEQIAAGTARFVDWEQAKAALDRRF